MSVFGSRSRVWCCDSFKSHYDNGGGRGPAVLVGRNYFGDPHVTFQFRAVDLGKENEINSQVPASLVIDIEIMHCPWCGRNVRKWYSRSVDELARSGLRIDRDTE